MGKLVDKLKALEKGHQANEQKIKGSDALTPAGKARRLTEGRQTFRTSWRHVRNQIIEDAQGEIDKQRRIADPAPSNDMLQRMSLLQNIYGPQWERNPAQMLNDAVVAGEAGDLAQLSLIASRATLLKDEDRRKALMEGVTLVREAYRTDAQNQAAQRATELESELAEFEMGSALREKNLTDFYPDLPPPKEAPHMESARA